MVPVWPEIVQALGERPQEGLRKALNALTPLLWRVLILAMETGSEGGSGGCWVITSSSVPRCALAEMFSPTLNPCPGPS